MNNIRILLPPGFRFECRECGKCCHRWNFRVDPDTYSSLQKTPFWDEMKTKFPGHEIIRFVEESGTAFMEKVDGACILFENNLCTIHKELGYDAKPLGCRRFPFFFTETPGGIFTGLSYVCPSVRDNTGLPIEEYLPLLQELASKGHFLHMVGSPAIITENITTDFAGYITIEEFLLKDMGDKDATSAFIRVLTSLALLIHSGKNAPGNVSPDEISHFLHNPHSDSFIDDPYFAGYQVQTAATMIALLESRDMEEARVSAGTILNGGTLESETFGRMISVKPLSEYANSPHPPADNPIFTNYIRHLLWWKYPLTTETILTGLSLMSLLPIMFDWYAGVSEAAEEVEETAEKSVSDSAIKTALNWIDIHIHHGRFLERYIKSFANDFLGQVEAFVEEGVM